MGHLMQDVIPQHRGQLSFNTQYDVIFYFIFFTYINAGLYKHVTSTTESRVTALTKLWECVGLGGLMKSIRWLLWQIRNNVSDKTTQCLQVSKSFYSQYLKIASFNLHL